MPEGKTIAYAVIDRDNYKGMEQFGTIAPSYLNQRKEIVDALTESATVEFLGWDYGDPESGESNIQSPVPGQALVLVVGEVVEGEIDDYGRETWRPLFDFEAYYENENSGGDDPGPLATTETFPEDNRFDDYWQTDYYKVLFVHAKNPDITDATVKVDVLSNTSTSIRFKMTPDKELVGYGYTYMENSDFEDLIDDFGSEEAAICWISIYSMYSFETEATEFYIDDELELGRDYRLIVVGKGNEEGTLYNVVKFPFEAKEPTKDAPHVVVTAITAPAGNEESPYEVWYNIKVSNKDALRARYAMDATGTFYREMNSAQNPLTLADIVAQGYAFSSEDVTAMNSDAGLNLKFDGVMDDFSYRLVVSAANDEDVFSVPNDKVEGEGWADNRTSLVPAETPVSSSLFTDLVGDWTATVKLWKSTYNTQIGGYEWTVNETPVTTKVTIRRETEVPELTQDVIALYKDEATARKWYESFKMSAANFDKRLKNQNRLVCDGLQISNFGFDFMSAWDLFCSKTYKSAYDTDDLFYDYGPKWYLQIGTGDVVTVPADYTTTRPLSAWKGSYYVYYLAGVNQNGSTTRAMSFNATVSSDHNTLTVLPTEVDGEMFYPAVGALYSSGMNVSAKVAEMTLTKGWTEASAAAARFSKLPESQKGETIPTDFTPVRPHSKTPLNLLDIQRASKQVILKEFKPADVRAGYREKAEKLNGSAR